METMLAVLSGSVAKAPPGLKVDGDEGGSGGPSLVEHFRSQHSKNVTVTLAGGMGTMMYATEKITSGNPLIPSSIYFAVSNDVFCLFRGHLSNFPILRQMYGLDKNINEATVVMQVYGAARDRGVYPLDSSVRDLEGKYAFVLYDASTKKAFFATDADGSVPFYWGVDAEDNLILSDGAEIVKKGCGRSFAPFPKGCLFTSTKGLRHAEQPRHILRAVHITDSKGEVSETEYEVYEKLKGLTMSTIKSHENIGADF